MATFEASVTDNIGPKYAIYVVAIPDTNEAHEQLLDGNPFVLGWDILRNGLTEEEAIDGVENRAILID